LSPRAVEEFRDLLTDRFGWRLEDDRGRLVELLESRLAPGQSRGDYLERLRAATPSSAEIRSLAEALAVSETYFFRNPEQFAALAEVALPAVIARNPSGPIRILSAGAASGEEAYSIAMTVLRLRRERRLPPVEILGVDFSRRAIERARQARYSAWALRGLPENLRAEHFESDGRHFDLRREVTSLVRFEERNLLDLRSAGGPWDIVFFRNTFMYFTPEAARAVLAAIADVMPPGAFLFLGHAETLRGLSDAFALRHTHGTFYYVREAAGAGDRACEAASLPPPDWQPPADDEWFHEIARATDRIAALMDRQVPSPDIRGTRADSDRAARASDAARAMALFRDERYEDALAALTIPDTPDAELLRAVLLANLGRTTEARESCARVLRADPLHAGAKYVEAFCAEREADDAAALRHDGMAIYLDDTFAMPHLHAALIEGRRGDRDSAMRHARRARELFEGEDELRIQLFGGGFGRQGLIQFCEAQLQALRS
jgi:chemotaxis protein methyltransferase CheR